MGGGREGGREGRELRELKGVYRTSELVTNPHHVGLTDGDIHTGTYIPLAWRDQNFHHFCCEHKL